MDPLKPHLDNLRDARAETDATLAILCPGQQHAQTILLETWEMIYDYLAKHQKTASLDEINTTTAAVYKLAQSGHHLTTLEHKVLEFEDKRTQLRLATQRTRDALADQPGLAPELRAQLEQELHLLT
jgi:hypothetical protein